MTNLSPEARRILGLARRGDDPLDVDRLRLDRRMAQRLALAAGATGLAVGSAKVASGAALATLIGKGVATGVVVTATAFGVWHARDYVDKLRAPTPALSATTAPMRAVPPAAPTRVPAIASEPNAAPPAEQTRVPEIASEPNAAPPCDKVPPTTTLASDLSVTTPHQQKSDRSDRERRAAPSSNLDPANDPLQDEVTALREAQQAIGAGDAQRALTLLAEQNRHFSSGALQQERSAARVIALCSLGRKPEARAEALVFERHWPRSPMLARVRRACDGDTSD